MFIKTNFKKLVVDIKHNQTSKVRDPSKDTGLNVKSLNY